MAERTNDNLPATSDVLLGTDGDAQTSDSAHIVFWVDPSETTPPERPPIDWECPCLGDLRGGPCKDVFKEAFECVHYSENDDDMKECTPLMVTMHQCVQEHKDDYPQYAEILKETDTTRDEDAAAEAESTSRE